MTFNVRMASARGDGVNAWDRRADVNVRAIQAQAPDLIGFQELQEPHLRVYRRRLDGYLSALGPEVSSRVHPEHPAIFWRPDRLRLIEAGGFYLSETPDRWSESWGTACVRGATWALLHPLGHERPLLHCNTHLDHESAAARVEGSRLILRRLAALAGGATCLLTGDFNAPAGSDVQRLYLDQGFEDMHQGDPEGTFHGFKGDRRGDRARIDWIMHRPGPLPLSPRRYEIVRFGEPPLFPSDHFPVVADFDLETATRRDP
jgi:endonuclease/exonuclease/phosphatase family metal-dependent hydrolase